jgi:hypothetical protein
VKAIYIAHPYRASTPEAIKANKERVKSIARQVMEQGHMPIVPHLAWGFLSDSPEDWNDALYLGLKLLERCDEMWVYGVLSEGVRDEIAFAKGKGILVQMKDSLASFSSFGFAFNKAMQRERLA